VAKSEAVAVRESLLPDGSGEAMHTEAMHTEAMHTKAMHTKAMHTEAMHTFMHTLLLSLMHTLMHTLTLRLDVCELNSMFYIISLYCVYISS
jgi:hypothetical protein